MEALHQNVEEGPSSSQRREHRLDGYLEPVILHRLRQYTHVVRVRVRSSGRYVNERESWVMMALLFGSDRTSSHSLTFFMST